MGRALVLVVLVVGGGLVAGAGPARAGGQVIEVTTVEDVIDPADGLTSLREAVSMLVPGPATIRLQPGATYPLDRCGTGEEDGNADGDLDVAVVGEITMVGAGATVRQVCDDERIVEVVTGDPDASSLIFEGVSLRGGEQGAVVAAGEVVLVDAEADGNRSMTAGGAITADRVRLLRSTLSANRAEGDGGAVVADQVVVDRAYLEGNDAGGDGGAISAGLIEVDNSTFRENRAAATGGAVHAGEVVIRFTTVVAGNVPDTATSRGIATGSLDAQASLVGSYDGRTDVPVCEVVQTDSSGYNADVDASCGFEDPLDVPLPDDPVDRAVAVGTLLVGEKGGPTFTAPPTTSSALIDAGPPSCDGLDQRGRPRQVGAACDVGAVEVGAVTTDVVTTTADVVDPDDGLRSLREAVHAANTATDPVEIVLDAGEQYRLTDCDRRALHLEWSPDVTFVGAATIEQTCPGQAALESYGHVVTDGLVLQRGGRSWVVSLDATDLRLVGASGSEPWLEANRPSTIDGLHVAGVEASGVLVRLEHGGRVDGGLLEGVRADVGIDVRFGAFRGDGLRVLDSELGAGVQTCGASELSGATFRSNRLGTAVLARPCPSTPGTEIVLDRLVVADNDLDGSLAVGGAAAVASDGVDTTVRSSSVVANRAAGTAAAGVAAHGADLVVENSTVAGNTSDAESAGVVADAGAVALHHVTVAANEGGPGSAAAAGTEISLQGTILANTGPACSTAADSGGANVASDATCALDHPLDREEVADTGLSPLDPSAEVPVLVPDEGSVPVDLDPTVDCGEALPLDQLGVERPWGDGCDAGAVERVDTLDDVPVGHPFYADVAWLIDRGITTGYPDGGFHPAAPVSRQAMAAFLFRAAGEPAFDVPGEASFSDVPVDHPFFVEVEWLAAEGIAGGYPDGGFHPAAAVSRQAMAAFLYRAGGEPAFDPPVEATFSDVPTEHPFSVEVEWLAAEGIAGGYADGGFHPTAAVSRQAMAAFLHRAEHLV